MNAFRKFHKQLSTGSCPSLPLYHCQHHYRSLYETAMQMSEIEARTILEATIRQPIFQLFRLFITQSIHKILHSDWLNLSGRYSPLTAREILLQLSTK